MPPTPAPPVPRPFRFGVMATPVSARQWTETARRAEALGFATLLTADGLQLPSPTASLSAAAAVTTTLRVGTFVTSAALRPAGYAAWEAHSLATLTGNRFEFGIGTGHPGTVKDAGDQLGLAPTTTSERRARVADTIERLRRLEETDRPATPTPVMMAAGGPKSTALAARVADIVTPAIDGAADAAQIAAATETLRAATAAAGTTPEIAYNIFVVGDEIPDWARPWVRVDIETLAANGSLSLLRGSTAAMAEELQRRREAYDISYVIAHAAYIDTMAPVVAQLAGH